MKAFPIVFAGLVWMLAAPAAWAGDLSADLGDAVQGHPGLKYFDLMKLVVTDLTPDGEGHNLVAFTHIEGKTSRIDPTDTVNVTSLEVMTLPGDNDRIILLADLGPSDGNVADVNMLALFKLGTKPRLLTVVEAGSDRFTGLQKIKPDMLAPGAPLILIDSSHNNADQSYQSTAMVYLDGDRFRFIDDVLSFGQANCSYEITQDPSYATLPTAGPYRSIQVKVRERIKRTGNDCGDEKPPRPGVKTYQATYVWDPAKRRFATTSKDLDRLAAKDQKLF